ncbi:contractile injection system tape measure protein [Kordia zhangzhouensis]|uniref:contractile injection system tape measure protein n=1 Tax=Kordia zhangzhouensis TaxID=1620405 RepID=UPI000629B5BF|nr:contractile injection system tape measure protein [Kordia zhangzhouensis]
MHSQGTHIITRCCWDTAFDSKKHSYQLQNDISAWSSYKMQRIINRVFDSICPEGQTLKIDKLQIDLGSIVYENLWSELPTRLEEALRSTLFELIMYPKRGEARLEIVHEYITQINVLRTFLQQGILPWNYQEAYGSISEIALSQLTNNRLDVIQMIQEIGKVENVRKRIAWQFSVVIIKKIIAGLEPSSHEQIIRFSDELIKIQEKETVVQTSTNDLRKNVWFWILNYLFTDRGTIFNKVAFVKSTIQQMAQHFNLTYQAMIELMESAIKQASEYYQVDKSFIAIIKLLSKELYEQPFIRIKTEKQKEHFWIKITDYFKDPNSAQSSIEKNELNELVINLPKLDSVRFQKILLAVKTSTHRWKTILHDLIPAAVESLFVVLSPSLSKQILEQISFLASLSLKNTAKMDTLDLYTHGLIFCVKHQHSSLEKDAFIQYVIEKIAKKQRLEKRTVLDQLLTNTALSEDKRPLFSSLYHTLHTNYQREINVSSFVVTNEATLKKSVETYFTQIQESSTTTKAYKKLEQTLEKWIQKAPIQFWEAVQKIEKNTQTTIRVSALVSNYGIVPFLRKVAPKIFQFIVSLQSIIEQLITRHAKKTAIFRKIKNHLFEHSFHILWNQPNIGVNDLMVQLFINIQREELTTHFSKTMIEETFETLFHSQKLKLLVPSTQIVQLCKTQFELQRNQTNISLVKELMAQPNQQLLVANLIKKIVIDKKDKEYEFKVHEAKIRSYLLPNSESIYKHLFKEFQQKKFTKNRFTTSINNKDIFDYCFWSVLIRFEKHRGNSASFCTLFEKTILEFFPILLKEKNQKTSKHSTITKRTIVVQNHRISETILFEALTQQIEHCNATIEIDSVFYSFSELFQIATETSPQRIRTILKDVLSSEKQLLFLQKSIDFEMFLSIIACNASPNQSAAIHAIRLLYVLTKELGNTQIVTSLQPVLWKQTVAMLQATYTAKKIIEILVQVIFDAFSQIPTLDQITIVKHIQNNHYKVPTLLKSVLIERDSIFELLTEKQPFIVAEKIFQELLENGKIEVLSDYLFTHFEIPVWLYSAKNYTYSKLINELITQQPLVVLKTIRSQLNSNVQLSTLAQTIQFHSFIDSLLRLYPTQKKSLVEISKLYEAITMTSIKGISIKKIQEIIITKILIAWKTNRWDTLKSTHIWNELLWEIHGKMGVNKNDFFTAINIIKPALPASLQLTYNRLLPSEDIVASFETTPEHLISKKLKKQSMSNESNTFPEEGIYIPNAGLVLLNSYFVILFNRLGIIKDNEFVSEQAQLESVHYLQYIVTGLTQTEESLLTLNKVLAGLAPNTPVQDSIDMTDSDKQLIDGMIEAVIQYWSAIGQTSVNGFRGNWLVREGVLKETEDRWELLVEKRPYDILMLKSPFSFSIIKLPWMQKPLHVTWPF